MATFINAYNMLTKRAGIEREPLPEEHPASPKQKLRSRAEVIIYNKDGVYAIKKDGYLLLPGGGIPEGQRPDEAAIVEALEEADRLCHNIEERGTVSTVYNKKYMKYKDWDGEVTHFFIALDGGSGGMNHIDREQFDVMPFNEAISYLEQLINDPKSEWAQHNNYTRATIIREAAKKATEDNSGLLPIKYAYWRQDLPRYIKRTGLYKSMASYIDALSGKNIVRAANYENALAAKKQLAKDLYNKELNKSIKDKAIVGLEKAKSRAPRTSWAGKMMDRIQGRSPSKIDSKIELLAQRSKNVDQGRLRRLENINTKLKRLSAPSVAGEQMRTDDARMLTGAVAVGGGIVGGNYLINKSKAKPFTSDGPAYMMPAGYREAINMPVNMPKQASDVPYIPPTESIQFTEGMRNALGKAIKNRVVRNTAIGAGVVGAGVTASAISKARRTGKDAK